MHIIHTHREKWINIMCVCIGWMNIMILALAYWKRRVRFVKWKWKKKSLGIISHSSCGQPFCFKNKRKIIYLIWCRKWEKNLTRKMNSIKREIARKAFHRVLVVDLVSNMKVCQQHTIEYILMKMNEKQTICSFCLLNKIKFVNSIYKQHNTHTDTHFYFLLYIW